jgi:hydroxymethylpyrimidine pyrophosphatase-like HAD family hydrolase
MNDYSAFEVVKHPIAMKNASKELKEKASYITEEAKNDGAGKAVNYLMTEV